MRQTSCLALLALLVLPHSAPAEEIARRVRAHTEYLASDRLEGRGSGSEGSRAAAAYIASEFEKAGLKPIDGDSYLQSFSIPGGQLKESNVVGYFRAIEATERSVVVTAHFDAYGIGEPDESGDAIYNGAADNAVGVGALIELAGVFGRASPPRHNLVFVATAAEEMGLHGSHYFAEHPPFPLEAISMVLNIDGFSILGPRSDYFVLPRQGVNFLDDIMALARELGWSYEPPEWIDSMNTNFDTATFLSRGVPAFTLWTGTRLQGGQPAPKANLASIHSPQDETTDQWDWTGVERHLELYSALVEEFLQRSSRDGIEVREPSLFEPD